MPDLVGTGFAIVALLGFVIAYAFVIAEEFTHLRKSKAMVVMAGVIWVLVAIAYARAGIPGAADLLKEQIGGYAELMLFLLAAMTYVNTLQERGVFNAIRDWLIGRGFRPRALFWISGVLAFFLSSSLDNLTTALVMGAVVVAVGAGNPRFIAIGCVKFTSRPGTCESAAAIASTSSALVRPLAQPSSGCSST